MADKAIRDPVDSTPPEVRAAIGENQKAYPHDECIPCGAVIHVGFFFDGFGRHRDYDGKNTSRYSNICRLWEAHRDNEDPRREQQSNQFWYPFYYSGLGTELNKEARDGQIVSAAFKLGKHAAKSVFFGVVIDSIPWFRDNRAIARVFGTGVEDRLMAAIKQFEKSIDDTKQKMPKIQRIQVSILGADRGCVLARALANELTRRYKHPSDTKLAFTDPKDPNQTAIPVEIKFLGLLDAVSSVMEENK